MSEQHTAEQPLFAMKTLVESFDAAQDAVREISTLGTAVQLFCEGKFDECFEGRHAEGVRILGVVIQRTADGLCDWIEGQLRSENARLLAEYKRGQRAG